MNAQAIVNELTEIYVRNPRLLAGLIAAKSVSVDDGACLIETMCRDAAREQQTPAIALGNDWISAAGFVLGKERVYAAMAPLPLIDKAAERLHEAIMGNYHDQTDPAPPAVAQVRAALVDVLAQMCEGLVEEFAAGRDPKQSFFDHEYLYSRIVDRAEAKAEMDREYQSLRAEYIRGLGQRFQVPAEAVPDAEVAG
jgi:hypothetical protein